MRRIRGEGYNTLAVSEGFASIRTFRRLALSALAILLCAEVRPCWAMPDLGWDAPSMDPTVESVANLYQQDMTSERAFGCIASYVGEGKNTPLLGSALAFLLMNRYSSIDQNAGVEFRDMVSQFVNGYPTLTHATATRKKHGTVRASSLEPSPVQRLALLHFVLDGISVHVSHPDAIKINKTYMALPAEQREVLASDLRDMQRAALLEHAKTEFKHILTPDPFTNLPGAMPWAEPRTPVSPGDPERRHDIALAGLAAALRLFHAEKGRFQHRIWSNSLHPDIQITEKEWAFREHDIKPLPDDYEPLFYRDLQTAVRITDPRLVEHIKREIRKGRLIHWLANLGDRGIYQIVLDHIGGFARIHILPVRHKETGTAMLALERAEEGDRGRFRLTADDRAGHLQAARFIDAPIVALHGLRKLETLGYRNMGDLLRMTSSHDVGLMLLSLGLAPAAGAIHGNYFKDVGTEMAVKILDREQSILQESPGTTGQPQSAQSFGKELLAVYAKILDACRVLGELGGYRLVPPQGVVRERDYRTHFLWHALHPQERFMLPDLTVDDWVVPAELALAVDFVEKSLGYVYNDGRWRPPAP